MTRFTNEAGQLLTAKVDNEAQYELYVNTRVVQMKKLDQYKDVPAA